jgi:proteasome-associated ATPase
MWYSQSEANYREVFRVAREAGRSQPGVPVILFFDEIDSAGAARGSLMRVDDRVVTAFAAELDGLEDRGNILVLAATNRADALDEALLRPGRLGDKIITVPRPNMEAARDIFGKYLRPTMPYGSGNGRPADPEEARQTIIDAAVSHIYAPNGQGEMAALVCRDGKRRAVHGRDLISGAVIAKVVSAAAEHACLREIETGRPGILLEDVLSAITDEFRTQISSLTPLNCHQRLTELPRDVDVVAIEPVARKVAQPHRYMHLEVA